MRVYQAVADELLKQGVRAVFVLMGEDTMKLIVEVTRRGISMYSVRNEHAAVGMADGYARGSGNVGVAILSRGPGLTQATNAIVNAAKANSSIVVLAGDSELRLRDEGGSELASTERKYVNQANVLEALGVMQTTLTSPDTATADVSAAFARARAGTAITVNMPPEVMRGVAGTEPSRSALDPDAGAASPPKAEDISLAADLLEETWAARRPLVLAGRGAVLSGAAADLERLGASIGALVGTSLLARSLFAGNPYDIGVVGTFSTPMASELVAECDLVLAFGASLNQYTTYRGDLIKKARLIHFDSHPRALGRYHPADMTVLGDASLAASALADELESRGHASSGYRSPEIAQRIKAFRIEDTFRDTSRPGALDPRSLMVAINKILPRERTVVTDSGNQFSFGTAFLAVPDPASYMFTGSYGSVGTGLGIALGAAVARPDRLTVLSIGDGGLMMGLGDLNTAVRYKLRLLVVVVNDSAFGAEVQLLRLEGLPDDAARYDNPSFEELGRALGADAITISTLEDLDQVPERLARMSGPLLLDCRVSTDVRAPHIDMFASGTSKASAATAAMPAATS